MAKITVDDSSRLVSAADLAFSRRGGRGKAPIDFARDHIVILDPATGRPVAECWPIEREAGAPPAQPVLAGVTPRATDVGQTGVPAGPLSEGQRETLQRLWAEHPAWTVDRVGDAFQRATGRSVSTATLAKYRTEGEASKAGRD